MKDPAFVLHFKNRRKAIQALQLIVAARENDMTNKQILSMPLFTSFFNSDYIKEKTSEQLEWKIKNILRDLGRIKFENLHTDFHDFKRHFENFKKQKSSYAK